jgi:serralysin
MEPVLFNGLTPTNYIWVSPTGSNSNIGSKTSPLKTIQAAVDNATAGTAIMVTAGVYYENVKLPTISPSTPDKPIWLMSASGPQAAKIIAKDNSVSTIYGYGTDNFVVQGFEIQGGFRGIQFSQSGSDWRNPVQNILVIDNVVHGSHEDGIKIGQTTNGYVVANTVYDVAEEGIDFTAATNAVIAYNEVYNARSAAAGIVTKSGSNGVLIHHNYVHDIPNGDGISIGGQGGGGGGTWRPGVPQVYQAKNVIVSENRVEDVDQNTVIVKGGQDSKIINNYLSADPAYYNNIVVTHGFQDPYNGPRVNQYSANIEIADNILVGKQNVVIKTGSNNNISIHDNAKSGQWAIAVGPDGHPDGVIFTGTASSTAGSGALNGTSSSDTLRGSAGNDTIYGLGGADKLSGGAGSDTIDGGNSNDYLFGESGRDVLTGGAGNDAFVFNTTPSGGIDQVTDFSPVYDSFRLENGVFGALTVTGPLASSAFYSGTAAHDSTDRIIYNPATGALTYDADGSGSRAPVQFAVLPTGLAMSASDFSIW